MIIVRNSMIPFEGYKAMTIWPFIFVQEDESFNKVDERHERIHGRQQVEMALVGAILSLVLYFLGCGWWSLLGLLLFYVWYVLEWLVRLVIGSNAYRNISFEQEAYENEGLPNYLEDRKPFSWVKYLFKSSK
jgi:fatty acid desaturase